jgi:hypothetical protein
MFSATSDLQLALLQAQCKLYEISSHEKIGNFELQLHMS